MKRIKPRRNGCVQYETRRCEDTPKSIVHVVVKSRSNIDAIVSLRLFALSIDDGSALHTDKLKDTGYSLAALTAIYPAIAFIGSRATIYLS